MADLHEVLVKLGFDPAKQNKGITAPIEPNRADNKENACQWIFASKAELNNVATKNHVWVDPRVLYDPTIKDLVTGDLWMLLGMRNDFAAVPQQEDPSHAKDGTRHAKDLYATVKAATLRLLCW